MFSGVRPTIVLLAAASLAASLWLEPAPVESAAPSSATRYARAAFNATNDERVERDRARLRQDACLQRFATRWAKHMAHTGRLVHQGLNPIASRCQLSYTGENIAMGFPSGRAVVRGWIHSPGHKENILRPQYRVMAIGAAKDEHGRWWSSQVFGRR